MTSTILHGDCLTVLPTLPADSVHCVVTSPPYYGLRDYGTARWEGGDVGCDHKESDRRNSRELGTFHGGDDTAQTHPYRERCRKCGARRVDSQLGLESTPEQYVARMVEVFREVRRVLRDDGTVWLNIGDSYANNGVADASKVGGFTGDRIRRGVKGTMDSRPRSIPDGLKPKDLIGIPWRLAFALQADGWWLRSEIIWHKCLSGGTRIYAKTKKGEMPTTLKDLVRLDPTTVKLWTGERWSQVVSWQETPRPDNPIEITLRSGERIGCTPNHVWPTHRGNVRADQLAIGDIIDSCRLPETEKPRMPELLPDEVGRFIGLYIAEGSQSDGTIQIAGHRDDDERWQWLTSFVARYDGYLAKHVTSPHGATININSPVILGIVNTYVSGATAHDKHLHPRCWARANTFLQSVLDGYLTGDGHWTGDRWRLGFCDNDNLAADLRTLCARLGLSLRLKRTSHTMTVGVERRRFPGWRGEIRLSHREHGSEIVAIERSRARKFWDVAIADAPHVFALASGVLTHNSNPMPESVKDRPTKAHEQVFLLAKSPRYFYDKDAILEPLVGKEVKRTKRNAEGVVEMKQRGSGTIAGSSAKGRNTRSVWTVNTKPFPEAHFAVMPEALVEPCVLAGTSAKGVCPRCGAGWERVVERINKSESVAGPKTKAKRDQGLVTAFSGYADGSTAPSFITTGWRPGCECDAGEPVPATVFDPFAGAGTVGVVAKRHGRDFVGIELNPDYIAMAQRRIDKTPYQATMTFE